MNTLSSNRNSSVNGGRVGQGIAIILGFWLIYCVFYLLEAPYHAFLTKFMTIRSEYTLPEQLSKFYLFVIMLVSVYSYRVLNQPVKIKLSIAFLLLNLVFYMSESNMISEMTQPVFGLIIFVCICALLSLGHFWLSLWIFVIGFGVIAFGVLSDFARENETIGSLLPEVVFKLLHITSEERLDEIGIALLCLSAILCFRGLLRDFAVNNTKAIILMVLASGMITSGNGFLHYQYNPSCKIQPIALLMTIGGFLALVFFNKRLNKKGAILTLVTEDLFYLFLFSFFVVLPSIHGDSRSTVALLVWLPFMLFLAIYLWRQHPAHTGNRTAGRRFAQ